MIAHLKPLNVRVQLQELVLKQKTERWSVSEPYLWNIFFKVDGEAITINPDFTISGRAIFSFSEGSHNNLRASVHRTGTLQVPQAIGAWETHLQPIKVPYFEQFIPGIAGVICVLMEENNVSNEGAEAGRIALGQQVQRAVNQALRNFDPKVLDLNDIHVSITQYFQAQVRNFADGIEKYVVEAIRTRQSLLRNVWSFLNADNLVGFHVWDFNHKILNENHGKLPLSHRWKSNKYGEWEITGTACVV